MAPKPNATTFLPPCGMWCCHWCSLRWWSLVFSTCPSWLRSPWTSWLTDSSLMMTTRSKARSEWALNVPQKFFGPLKWVCCNSTTAQHKTSLSPNSDLLLHCPDAVMCWRSFHSSPFEDCTRWGNCSLASWVDSRMSWLLLCFLSVGSVQTRDLFHCWSQSLAFCLLFYAGFTPTHDK